MIADANKEICWIHCGPYPVEVGFTMSAKALRAEFKRLGDPIPKGEELNGKAANAIVWHATPSGSWNRHCVCYLPKVPAGVTEVQVAAMLCHEALHIVQQVWERMGEIVRCEAEAYLLQHIFQSMYSHYRQAIGIDKPPPE